MIDLSTAINEEFHRFTGYNEILSLTGGIVAFTSTIPIKRIGKLTGAEESMAKRTKKNGIAVFGKLYKWTDIEEIKVFINNNIIDSTTNTYREPFSSSLIYDLHRLIAELKDNNLAAIPKLYHRLRNNPELLKYLYDYLIGSQYYKFHFIANYCSLITR